MCVRFFVSLFKPDLDRYDHKGRRDYSGVDHPLVEGREASSTRVSCGEIPSAHQSQLGPLGTDGVLSTPVQSVHDSIMREQAGLATSHDELREHPIRG